VHLGLHALYSLKKMSQFMLILRPHHEYFPHCNFNNLDSKMKDAHI